MVPYAGTTKKKKEMMMTWCIIRFSKRTEMDGHTILACWLLGRLIERSIDSEVTSSLLCMVWLLCCCLQL